MPVKIIMNNRGIAILVTLTVITIIIVSALEMNRRMRSAVFSSAATRDRMTLFHMASSGIHAAQALLIKDRNNSNSDSLQEEWADPNKINEILKDINFDDGKITLQINDELGKIQINSLVKFPEGRDFNTPQRVLWENLLFLLTSQDETYEDIEAAAIINPVKDWLDSGDDEAITGLSGAESDYYQDFDPPYTCRNGPFTHVSEIVLVKGITRELFHGAGGSAGVSKYITIQGLTSEGGNSFTYEGKININTADLPVLAVILPAGSEGLAQTMYDYRQETSDGVFIHDLSNVNWYKNIPGFGDLEIDPDLITVSSDLFRIVSVATLNKMQIKITVVVQREKEEKTGKWRCRVLHWETE